MKYRKLPMCSFYFADSRWILLSADSEGFIPLTFTATQEIIIRDGGSRSNIFRDSLSQSLDSGPCLEVFRERTAQSLDATSYSNHLGWHLFVEYLLHSFSDETITNKICFPLWTLPTHCHTEVEHLPVWLGHFSVSLRMRLTLRAQSLLEGSESACLCIHEVWFCLKSEFPEQDDVMVPYGLCFMVSLRLSVPAQSCVKAVLEALKRYLSMWQIFLMA